MQKISEYTTERTSLQDTDRFDVSADLGGGSWATQYLGYASLKTQLGTAGFLSSGDNISELTNDSNFVASGANVSVFANDAGYLVSGEGGIYSGSGTLSGITTVTMSGNSIDFNGGVVTVGNPSIYNTEIFSVDGRSAFNTGMGVGVAPGVSALKVAPSASGNKSLQIFEENGTTEIMSIKGNRDWTLNSSSASRFGFGTSTNAATVVRIQADGTNDSLSILDSGGTQQFTVEDDGKVGLSLSGANVDSSVVFHVGGDVRFDGTTSASSSGASGTFLQINVGGTNYKLDLHTV